MKQSNENKLKLLKELEADLMSKKWPGQFYKPLMMFFAWKKSTLQNSI